MNDLGPLDPDSSLADLASTTPAAAGILHHHQLDYCCGGRRSLRDACQARGIDPQTVLHELRETPEAPMAEGPGSAWEQDPLPTLIEHILERYHQGLRDELPRLIELASKVERVHADKQDCPHGVAEQLRRIAEAAEEHMDKEEQVLFPLIVAGRGPDAAMPVRCMEAEHADHGNNLRRLRELTHDYQLPEGACASWWSLYDGLQRFEREFMDHIHLENNVLFPRALGAHPDEQR